MSSGGFPWTDIIDWVSDLIAFRGSNQTLGRRFPAVEAKDGQEPTVESQRQEARQADAKMKSEPSKQLAATDKKTLDKEFWDSM